MNRKGAVYFQDVLCGYIENVEGDYFFYYTDEYLSRDDCKPVSLTLPLGKEKYVSKQLFSFFDGLIPEGYLLNLAIQKWKLNHKDRMDLLLKLCDDCIGAVSVKEVK